VEALEVDDRVVGVTAGVVDGELESDVRHPERQIRIFERSILDARAHGERREVLRPIRAADLSGHGDRSRRPELVEIVRVDRRDERQDRGELRVRRGKSDVEPEQRIAGGYRAATVEEEPVQSERVVAEPEAVRAEIGVYVRGEVE
jgi:hypothetical protein